MLDSVMSQHSRPELSLECAVEGQITGADPGFFFQLASLVVMKHAEALEMKCRSCQSILTSNSVFLLANFRLASKPLEIKAGLVHPYDGCQRGTCSRVNAVEGTGKVCELSWPQEGEFSGMGVEQGKTAVCAARNTGSSAAKLKAGTIFQEPLTESAILHWNRKSSTCLHEGLWSYSMVLV